MAMGAVTSALVSFSTAATIWDLYCEITLKRNVAFWDLTFIPLQTGFGDRGGHVRAGVLVGRRNYLGFVLRFFFK